MMRKINLFVTCILAIIIFDAASILAQEIVAFDLHASVMSEQAELNKEGSFWSTNDQRPYHIYHVLPGQTILWEIWVRIDSMPSEGLAMVSVDLVQDAGNPVQFVIPPAIGVPSGMSNFSRPDGISNPGEGGAVSGYIGVQRDGNLIQIGGSQNSFGSALQGGIGENATIVTGIGVGQDVLLARGSFSVPKTPGLYRFRLENGLANIFDEINTPPEYSPVSEATVIYDSFTLDLVVGHP